MHLSPGRSRRGSDDCGHFSGLFVAAEGFKSLIFKKTNVNKRRLLIVAAVSFLIVLISSLVLWLTLEISFPAVVYRYSTAKTQDRFFFRQLQSIQPGDSLITVQKKLSFIISKPLPENIQIVQHDSGGYRYIIEFLDGKVKSKKGFVLR